MLQLFYQHYRKFLLWIIAGMVAVNGIALTVYYTDNSINLEKFNSLMMLYGVGVVTILPFAVTFDAKKRLKAFLPYRSGKHGWYLGILTNSVVCFVSWLFGLVEILLKLILAQPLEMVFVYLVALLLGSFLVLALGGFIGWFAYKMASLY